MKGKQAASVSDGVGASPRPIPLDFTVWVTLDMDKPGEETPVQCVANYYPGAPGEERVEVVGVFDCNHGFEVSGHMDDAAEAVVEGTAIYWGRERMEKLTHG
jgi:hypothetical protein